VLFLSFSAFKESESVIAFAEYNTIHTLVVMELKKKWGKSCARHKIDFKNCNWCKKERKVSGMI